uniref:Uncharacterized protein n=1 Tax=Amphora coffeiformis TaxID=265554 RepID=A0A7S3PAP7_9STRA|mmetsp:Transcript_3483/g.6650  ORF Transcript_3483/g.6650 Transcript_3483/m.6650 type:complete len:747 (+) Transcript_3483:357-2597(+)|eukprot:scaffold6610_cov163-Amphora_coffeaeformis.AAC.6
MACSDEKESSSSAGNGSSESLGVSTTSPEKPRRNLTKDFALCLDKGAVVPEGMKSDTDTAPTPLTNKLDGSHSSIFSPTSVIPSGIQNSPVVEKSLSSYRFHLHPSLQRGLSDALIGRVSFYGIIHDINKEASAMAANDPKQPDFEECKEESSCALVQAAVGNQNAGTNENGNQSEKPLPNALIDEEAWLLQVVEERDPEERTTTVCPPTFPQAMGEREYENPVQALSGQSRTQLWKPSRSWWEAKSGKNPWIEPSSHNKRWRYLWPLIHYHKFLAKCIKKLKRNGVDVKHAVSPVAVFLREEVCAVSDHLAECSRFDSDEWMSCLKLFNGWTEIGAEDGLRERVRLLKLRSLHEPGDVESKLLRDQVDRHFLTAMAKARAQLREGNEPMVSSGDGGRSRGQPPVYPRSGLRNDSTPGYQHQGSRRQQYHSPGGHEHFGAHHAPHHSPYWGWEHHSMVSPYGDNSSVHSALSNDSGYVQPPYPMYMHPVAPHAYPHYYSGPMVYPPCPPGGTNHREYIHGEESPGHHQSWVDPAAYGTQMYHPYPTPFALAHGVPVEVSEVSAQEDVSEAADMDFPPTEQSIDGKEATPPVKFHMQAQQQQSPFWAHLDSVAVGLATPAKSSPTGTPRRFNPQDVQDNDDSSGYAASAQPIILRAHRHYGHYGARDGYAPPSPATQFMMSPQQNFASTYGYTYNRSPRKKSPNQTSNTGNLTPPPVRKIVAPHDTPRESPTTVGTTESESLPEGTA